jgi:hypothetical protein
MTKATSKLGRRTFRLALVLAMATGALLAGAGCGGGGGGGPSADPSTDVSTGGTSNGTSTGTSPTRSGSAGGPTSTGGTSAAGATTAPGAAASSGVQATQAVTPATDGTAPAAASPTPANAAAPASAAAAPAAAPAGGNHPGTIIPLYSVPSSGTWAAVAAAKRAHPAVPVMAVINPASGPGTAALSDYMAGIADLTAAGVKVIGYVHTSYGKRATAEINADVDRWRNLYPSVTGIFLDEMANTPGLESFYSGINGYAKSKGYDFTIGNPGADGAATYVGTVDTILIYENKGLPSAGAIGGWHGGYDRRNFGIIPYGVSGVDAGFLRTATRTCGYVYLSSDDLPNPWDTVPAYLDGLVATLSTL